MALRFSIIIPTYRRPELLARLLKQLRGQTYPASAYEVIVVSNDPHDQRTKRTVRRFQARWPQLSYAVESKQGASPARNRGISLARFSHLIFLDDDMEVGPDFLSAYQTAWKRYPQARLLGGGIDARPVPDESLTAAQRQLLLHHPWCFGQTPLGSTDRQLQLGELVFSGNLSYRRRRGQSDLFHPGMGIVAYGLGRVGGEDYELTSRTLLEKDVVVQVADPHLVATQAVAVERFTDHYVAQRFFMAGLEIALQEKYLRLRFPNFRSFYRRRLLTWNGVSSLVRSRCDRIMLLSYLLNGRLFYFP